jgi:hypothetical protein
VTNAAIVSVQATVFVILYVASGWFLHIDRRTASPCSTAPQALVYSTSFHVLLFYLGQKKLGRDISLSLIAAVNQGRS